MNNGGSIPFFGMCHVFLFYVAAAAPPPTVVPRALGTTPSDVFAETKLLRVFTFSITF